MLSQFQLPSKLSFTKSLEEQTRVKARCVKKQQAKQFCTNLSCHCQSMFTCLSQYCQCHNDHVKCEQKPIQSILAKIREKMNVKEINISELIESKFDHLIDHLSDVRDKLIGQLLLIKEEIRLSKLTNLEKVFLKLLKNQALNEEQITNIKDTDEESFSFEDYKKLCYFISEETQPCSLSFLGQLELNLKHFQFMSNKSVSQFQEQCNNFFVEFECKQKSWQILAKQEIIILNQVGKVGKQIIDKSAIVRSIDQARNLITFFLPQKIQKIQLLFRASQNNFEIKSFFDLYGNESNTLLLCKTNKEKIIGGYTPLSHLYAEKSNLKRSKYQNSEDFYGKDPSNSSFIFSLSNNDKFSLRNSDHAVYRSKDKLRICFGDMQGQLSICDRSNVRAESKSNINSFVKEGDNFELKFPTSSYYNPNYKGSDGFNVDKQSLIRFNGNAGLFFTTKQWQIWKVYM